MKTMELMLLVTGAMQPIPQNIEVIKNYGMESVVPGDPNHQHLKDLENKIDGEAVHLKGLESNFIAWLKDFDGVWITENIGIGNWRAVHIKPKLAT